jgi:uncharacterized protein (TIGR02117 family)
MKYFLKKILLFSLLLLLFINGISETNCDYSNISDEIVYIVKHEWHTGLVVNRTSAEKYLPSLKKEFNNSDFIEIGWGDKDFYMAEKETLWLGLKAVLWPTKSVIHVSAFNIHPEIYYKNNKKFKLELVAADYNNLLDYINKSIYIDEIGNNILLSDKQNKTSRFYLSKEKYHLFKTCNVWIAKSLKEAGISINPIFALTSGNVIKQLKRRTK